VPKAAARSGGRHTSKASHRLQRLLAVVPYIVSHPGASLSEIAQLFEVSESELVEDLNLLFVSGLPPYGPGDLIDVEMDEGRVWITMADYFSRPIRLTRSEALALYLKGKALLGAPGLEEASDLTSALDKIEKGMGPETLGQLVGRVEVGPAGFVASALAAIRRAVEGHERLHIEYYTAARDELAERDIEPEHVFSALGNWYVVAWDRRADAERLFRVDRVRTVTEAGETFHPRGLSGPGRPLYTRSPQDIPVRLAVGPSARWVAEYYDVAGTKKLDDGWIEVTLPAKDLPWVARLVLRLGADARVLDPPELAALVRETASETLGQYREGTSGRDPLLPPA